VIDYLSMRGKKRREKGKESEDVVADKLRRGTALYQGGGIRREDNLVHRCSRKEEGGKEHSLMSLTKPRAWRLNS